jgi:hypothetical protein
MTIYETESNYLDNQILQNITSKLYKLRVIECKNININSKYRNAKSLLKKVFNELLKIDNYVIYRKLWEELHDRQAYYYEYNNNIQKSKKIPFLRHTLHNQVVPDWLRMNSKIKPEHPILHFDTHDDMDVMRKVDNYCLNLKEIKKGACGMINHPITCMIWLGYINKVVWCTPEWVYDDDIELEQALIIDRTKNMKYIRGNDQPIDKYILKNTTKIVKLKEMKPSSNYKFYKKFNFYRYHFYNKRQWNILAKKDNIIDIKSKYILDIDLDFFACEGTNYTKKEYIKNFGDLCSTNRISELPSTTNPRNELENKEAIDINKKIKKELKLIDKRIDIFLNGLKLLKKYGKTPSIINISDSASSLFSGMNSRAVLTNSYCPKYLVPYINNKLINGFIKLKFIDN